MPLTVAVEAIVVVLSPMHADLYALLQCGEDSEYGRKAYGSYIEVFCALLVEDGESSPSASGNF
jgi:glucosinolate gamma-glutamyl hydrolase